MTEPSFPITPPPELVRQWRIQIEYCSTRASRETLLAQIFAAGADQELEACCEWLEQNCGRWELPAALRAARRPKPQSLKEQALETLRSMQIKPVIIDGLNVNKDVMEKYDIIRRALEQLDD